MRRTTVEQCLTLDVNQLARHNLVGNHDASAVIGLGQKCVALPPFRIEYVLGRDGDRATAFLRYHIAYLWRQETVTERIPLDDTRMCSGGWRWWFLCPFAHPGGPCGRRVAKLYLPPGAVRFGCRICWALTYRSSQEHNCRSDPEPVKRCLD